MKSLAQSLPAGLSPEPTQISGPPRSESVTPPAPGVCALCAEHWPEIWGRHYRVSEQNPKGEDLGPCTTPPRPRDPKPEAQRRLTHDAALALLHEKATRGSAARVIAEARETFATHSEPSEEDDDA